MKCPEDAVGEEIKNAIEKDQEIMVNNTIQKIVSILETSALLAKMALVK